MTEIRSPSNPAIEVMRDLARRLHGMGGDMQSVGESIAADAGIMSALADLQQAFDVVEKAVAQKRNALVVSQITKLAESEEKLSNLKLHFGAGGIRLPGWVNVDEPPAELSLNVARGIPLPSGCARFIYASHLLEHLYYPVEATRFVLECRRLLASGGVIRLVVPDIGESLQAYAAGDATYFSRRQQQWPGWPAGRTMLEDILAYAGAFPDPAAFFEAHKYGYDFETLSRLLTACGFSKIKRCSYMGSDHVDLCLDDRSTVASAAHSSGHYSLFIEAEAG